MKLFSLRKTVVFCIFSLLFLPLFVAVAQDSGNTGTVAVPGTDESAIYLDAGNADLPAARQAKGPSSVLVLLRVVIVLAIVCAAIYGVVWLLKKTTVVNAANDPYLKAVSSITLAPNKTVQVITIGTKAYLVGVTDQGITLIDEVTDRELIDAMNLEADRKASQPHANFASVLSSFLSKTEAHVKNTNRTPSDQAKEAYGSGAADVIRKQRARLSGGSDDAKKEDAGGNE